MKRIFGLCLTSLLSISIANSQNNPYFTSHPALTPDAKTIIFSYEGDLWKVPSEGGLAARITALTGDEINPKISPDGKYLAFSSNQFGNYDVFIMPLEGGEIKQLTFNDASDEVDSWSWDSEKIYFTSGRQNRFTSYSVSKNGGTAIRLFPHYFNTIHQVNELPNGELIFGNSWESQSQASRKRYKGEFNPDLLSYHPINKTFKQYTDWEGKDFWSSSDKNGNIYFVSDELNGEYNLYTFKNSIKTPLTRFETSIKRPVVSANGEKVVFERDYQIYVYDVATQKSQAIPVQLSRNPILAKESSFNVKDNASYFDISPDGKKLAFVSRGELFISDVNGKFIKQIPLNQERVFEVKWLKDNKTLIFSQTFKGYPNWFTVSADNFDQIKQLTFDERSNRMLAFNPAHNQGVYLSGRDEVRIIDLETLKSRTVVKDEIWGFQNSAPSFSPNGEYVLFTAVRNFEQDIFVHHFSTNKTLNLTQTGVTEASPTWSPDGKSLYFVSNPTKPSYPFGLQNASIYEMKLDKFDEPTKNDKFDELFQDGNSNKEAKTDAKSDSKSEESIKISINTHNLRSRTSRLGPASGTQNNPIAFKKGAKTYVFFNSNHEGRSSVYRIVLEDFENNKTEKVTDGFMSNMIEANGKYYLLMRGSMHSYNIDQNRLEKINTDFAFNKNLKLEFSQMFYETWAGLEENFYESNFHGIDWKKVRDNYAKFLPHINNRNDLRILLNDMLGELNSSHLGFSSSGQEEQKNLRYVTNETGILFNNTDPYRVLRVIENGPADKIGMDIQPGDKLVAVDGEIVNAQTDRDYYFTTPTLLDEMELTFDRNGQQFSKIIKPIRGAAAKDLIYDEWIQKNRKRTDSLSNNQIAYSHMKNMSTPELERFLMDMVEQEYHKKGIILDLRFNTGGNVHDEVLKFLSQRPYLQWQYRGGKLAPQSNFGPAGKPIVLLINEQSLSDAEMTAAGFKALNLGTIIGTETYRWIIFTSSKGLVDGSSYRVPGWGTYTLSGENLEHTGVAPDIYVKNTVLDRIQDKDPQLERAVQEILKKL